MQSSDHMINIFFVTLSTSRGGKKGPSDGIVHMCLRDKSLEDACRYDRSAGLKLLATVRRRPCKPRHLHISVIGQRKAIDSCEAIVVFERVHLSLDLQ